MLSETRSHSGLVLGLGLVLVLLLPRFVYFCFSTKQVQYWIIRDGCGVTSGYLVHMELDG